MKYLRHLVCLLFAAVTLLAFTQCSSEKEDHASYESVPNDPMQTRIYTLDNGLKVYLSVNKEKPRIQTSIAVRVGSKNDPAETTGLSHYLEHLMFKGTQQYGTMDYAAEQPYLEQIKDLYEIYRKQSDPADRALTYSKIDSISYLASSYFIPNEYDKLMSAIGSEGTNAYTSFDETVYVENIPSNQIENWATIQSDRFQNMVIRGFHTELEAVYEEKNISLDRDGSRMIDSIMAMAFPNYPYGTQTTIGTQEHLKNPSIINIQNHFDKYYVANNIAICMAGDLDPESTVKILNEKFGKMRTNDSLKPMTPPAIEPLSQPRVANIYGQEAANLYLAYPMPSVSDKETVVIPIISNLLYNGMTGLIDVDVNQPLKVLESFAFNWNLADYQLMFLGGTPNQGQTLEQVRDILLDEVAKLRSGDFDEEMLKAIVNNERYDKLLSLESNNARVSSMVNAFIKRMPWKDVVDRLEEMKKVTKDQIVAFANKYMGPESYVIAYKHQGENKTIQKVEKPKITAIKMNRDSVSNFVQKIQESTPNPINPQFVNFAESLKQFELRPGVEVMYSPNSLNELFSVSYVFDYGRANSRTLGLAGSYSDLLASKDMTLKQFNDKMYAIAANYSINVSEDQTVITVRGLDENISEALSLVQDRLTNLVPDDKIFADFISNELQSRENLLTDQNSIARALLYYSEYGPHNPYNNVLKNQELKSLDPQQLVDEIQSLFRMPHKVVFYARNDVEAAEKILAEAHPKVGENIEIPQAKYNFKMPVTNENKVYVADFQSTRALVYMTSNHDVMYDLKLQPVVALYNSYFGGSMNAIVFQEIREARALAYSTFATYTTPRRLKDPRYNIAFVGTQADKMPDAIDAMLEILHKMPQSEAAFKVGKDASMMEIRTQRYTARSIPWYYLSLQRLDLSTDPNKYLFDHIPALNLDSVVKFQERYIMDNKYNFAITGDQSKLDLNYLKKLGNVELVPVKTLYGF